MKVFLDSCMQYKEGTGIGQYTMHLYHNLKKKDIDVSIDDFKLDNVHGMKKYLRYLKYINSSEYLNKLSNYDIVHYTCFHMPFRSIKSAKTVVTVHDLAFVLYPSTMSKSAALFSKIMLKNTLKKADQILTVSKSVFDELVKLFPEYKRKYKYIYPGVYENIKKKEITEPYHNDKLKNLDKFFLYVGTIEIRKNVGKIIEAFFMLKKNCPSARVYKLVLAGKMGYGSEVFQENVLKSEFRDDVIFAGYVDDNDCNRLYSSASAYVFPTFYEGFGSTQLECMEYHLPLILSDISTNLEVSKDYGLFFSLENIDGLVSQMKSIALGEYDYYQHNAAADRIIERFQWSNLINDYIKNYEMLI